MRLRAPRPARREQLGRAPDPGAAGAGRRRAGRRARSPLADAATPAATPDRRRTRPGAGRRRVGRRLPRRSREALAHRDPAGALAALRRGRSAATPHVDFVVVMALDRTRYTPPRPRPDRQAVRRRPRRRAGGAAVHPGVHRHARPLDARGGAGVRRDGGRVVALVSVGITVQRIDEQLRARRCPRSRWRPRWSLGVGLLGAWLISRRLRRQTHGLGEREITRMYEYYDAVLHAVREGLLLRRRPTAGCSWSTTRPGGCSTCPTTSVGPAGRTTSACRPALVARRARRPTRETDEIHLADDARAGGQHRARRRWQGREVGTVVTLRDHTELQAVDRRARHGPRARRVAALAEPRGRQPAAHGGVPDRDGPHRGGGGLRHRGARRSRSCSPTGWSAPSATRCVAALLLGKTAAGRRARRASCTIDRRTTSTGCRVAAARPRDDPRQPGRQRARRRAASRDGARGSRSTLERSTTGLRSRVGDSGPGVPAGPRPTRCFERGWSTKASDGAGRVAARAGPGRPGRPALRRARSAVGRSDARRRRVRRSRDRDRAVTPA